MSQPRPTVFTIGHSNHPAEVFLELLLTHAIEEVVDVRSSPHSRYNPQFNRKTLQAALADTGVGYVFMGGELGGRPADPSCYDGAGRVQYDRLAETEAFNAGVRQVIQRASECRIALTCSEKEPLACHRTLLIARVLTARGVAVAHILADGSLEGLRRRHEPPAGRVQLTQRRRPVPLQGGAYRRRCAQAGAAGGVRQAAGQSLILYS